MLTQVKWWDVWMGFMLLFTALVTPYQVAFLRPSAISEYAVSHVSACSSHLQVEPAQRDIITGCRRDT